MTNTELRKNIKEFIFNWTGKGYEKGQCQPFWLSLLSNVLCIKHPETCISFEDQVHLDHTSFIDGYIKETHVLIEQKSLGKDLRSPIKQSDGSMLTPFQQAKRYSSELPYDDRPRWIVTCNFEEFLVYDMNQPNGEPASIFLKNLEKEYYRLQFLIDTKDKNIKKEMDISLQAGELVGKLYDALLSQYDNTEKAETLHSLNALCVRLVFCFYAEDAGLFGTHTAFHDYIQSFNPANARLALIELFKMLDTPIEKRDKYEDPKLLAFPYVNGGLFADESIEIPRFNDDILRLMLSDCSENFDWSGISPTIFGAVFESTLNPETRRSGGMHYTSIENIHKVIDPLFLDSLKLELSNIEAITIIKKRNQQLTVFLDKLASLNFLDPACGSGNFLTETFLSLRRLENHILRILRGAGTQLSIGGEFTPIRVSISQFYGIEINDFAATVAKTALWIAESQMMHETEDIVEHDLKFLPLKTYTNICEGNALRIDWNDVIPAKKISYIMGNPPFIGQAMRTKEQADDMQSVFKPLKIGGKLDYVAGWYKKAADLMDGTNIQTAFVSSNSICQGESVNLLWQYLLNHGIFINFAYPTFSWTSESADAAAVMCVIVGFSFKEKEKKVLFEATGGISVSHINGYLKAAPDVFIKNRNKGINGSLAKVVQGSPPADDGKLLLSVEEREMLIRKYPELEEVINPFVGSREYINDIGFSRYCLWLEGKQPDKYQHIPELMERFKHVREFRLRSPVDRIQKTADRPWLFTQNRQPSTNYLIIPRVSSERRRYIPIGFLSPNVIASDAVVLVYNASLYDFGIISSNVHNAWMRVVAGRLKSDYRYAPSVYYNFPFPQCNDEQRKKIEETANDILKARLTHKDHNLADMYGEHMYLYPDLLTAHQQNDRAVMEAYGFTPIKNYSESDCVTALMKIYQKLIK